MNEEEPMRGTILAALGLFILFFSVWSSSLCVDSAYISTLVSFSDYSQSLVLAEP